MIINHNITALNTHNKLSSASSAQSKSMEKLASGLRINRAGDDAAGLAISEKMRAQVRGLDQASRNAQDGISMIQTAEGALNETHDILQRMRELSVQSSNDTNTADDRKSIGDEIFELKKEVDRISETTKFNGKGLLNGELSTAQDPTSTAKLGATAGAGAVISKVDVSGAAAGTTYTLADGTAADGKLTMNAVVNGKTVSETINVSANSQTLNFSSLGISIELAGTETSTAIEAGLSGKTIITTAGNSNATFQVGSNGEAAEKITVNFKKMDSSTLGSGGLNDIADKVTDNTAVDSVAKADALTKILDDSIKQVSQQRSNLGANQNRLEHTINNLKTSSENLTAAESRVRDVDMAKEMMNQTKNSILAQAAQAMLAQSNQTPQGVLQLLR